MAAALGDRDPTAITRAQLSNKSYTVEAAKVIAEALEKMTAITEVGTGGGEGEITWGAQCCACSRSFRGACSEVEVFMCVFDVSQNLVESSPPSLLTLDDIEASFAPLSSSSLAHYRKNSISNQRTNGHFGIIITTLMCCITSTGWIMSLPVHTLKQTNVPPPSPPPHTEHTIINAIPPYHCSNQVDFSDIIAGRSKEIGLEVLSAVCGGVRDRELSYVDVSENAMGPDGVNACRPALVGKRGLRALFMCNDGLSETAMEAVRVSNRGHGMHGNRT